MKNKSKLTGADYLLLLLYLDNQKPINSAVRLTKMMFIFKEEIAPLLRKNGVTIDDLPMFTAYNYGPFSKDVYEQVELFQSIEFITVKDLNATEEMDEVDDWEENAFIDEFTEESEQYKNSRDGKYMQYKILKRGKEYVKSEIIPQISDTQVEILSTFKERIIKTPIKAILKYVYVKYPDMTENSLIKGEVLGHE